MQKSKETLEINHIINDTFINNIKNSTNLVEIINAILKVSNDLNKLLKNVKIVLSDINSDLDNIIADTVEIEETKQRLINKINFYNKLK